jgi:hypothetical protein
MATKEASDRQPLQVGDRVFVRSGLDVLPGTVVDRYGSGSHARVVVSLESAVGADRDAATVAIPESEVYRAEEASELDPPGTWVNGQTFERQVYEAIVRLLRTKKVDPSLEQVVVEHARSDDVADLLLQTPESQAAIEVKFIRQPQIGRRLAESIAALLDRLPEDTGRLIVSNAEFPDTIARLLLDRHVLPVTWRSVDDDSELLRALSAALAHHSDVKARIPLATIVKTGEICPESGLWQVVSTPSATAPIAKGQRMPSYNRHAVRWQLVQYA